MERDLAKFEYWMAWHRNIECADFERAKAKAFKDAESAENEQAKQAMLFKARKMKFQFDKSKLINYGNCTKLDKSVSFIPNACQLETQFCWESRN